jgi:copper chaperone
MAATTTLQVKGMSCNHCVNAVTSALKELGGVNTVSVDLAAGRVTISYDETAVDLEKMKEAIAEAGYDVVS